MRFDSSIRCCKIIKMETNNHVAFNLPTIFHSCHSIFTRVLNIDYHSMTESIQNNRIHLMLQCSNLSETFNWQTQIHYWAPLASDIECPQYISLLIEDNLAEWKTWSNAFWMNSHFIFNTINSIASFDIELFIWWWYEI